ncbi:DNA-(apurinic or apyrimidinic site) lyase APN1 [Aspergillus melleus]|uniref:DNA-(apurinic or apyrimidinic site) lyase APN1 n=1 Tax=Aspergillus melleus TaxID=138277 RepID=UPI001E8D52E4|nr:DNA-(apurinic or apyrimidinic site) lyase [Aspergillus melleus]KAH8427795.1 DNA-(apurinic or apyrimidinic site) lyase [Aspergillus melleus]
MPPRTTRKASGGAPRATEPTSPANKRKTNEPAELSSPARRSKRVKSTDELKAVSAGSAKANGAVKEEVKEETKVAVVEKADDKLAVIEKSTTKKRKTKQEKEAEMLPLRARTPGLRMFVGAHVSAAKGVFNSINNSTHIGGNAFALFLKSQRKWDNPPLQDDHRDQFRKLCAEQNYDAAQHILPHGSYLVNLAQEDKAKAKQAYDAFLDDLQRCEALGIKLYNFHPGSANQTTHSSALARLAKALTAALTATTSVIPVLETMCGHGSTIGGKLSEFRDLLALIPSDLHPRIGICIDTCHSFAAGYDLSSPAGFKSFLSEFDSLIGLHHLRALHLNDSKAPRGSKRDLHANIGTGFLGLRAFHNVMNEKRFENLPMVLETPIDRPDPSAKAGAKKTSTVPDPRVWAEEIALLESLIGMDPEGEEFRALESRLSEEGKEMREKQQEQYDRKVETEKKKQAKAEQRSLMDMMGGSKGKKEKKQEEESEDEGCQSHSED